MAEPSVIEERFEKKLTSIIKGAEQRGSGYLDDEVNEIRSLLLKAGKNEWSARPRTYAVLKMIDMPNMMDQFVDKGLSDYNLPYTVGKVPLCIRDPTLRRNFVTKQHLVLTDIKGAEGGDHASLATHASAHFTVLDRLGRGGQAVVEKVRSNLSLEDYARKSMLRSKKFEGSTDSEIAFTNELRNLKRLSHLHLVQYVGSYTDPQVFAVLLLPIAEYDLKTYLSRDPFPQGDLSFLRDFFGCITSAITYLHRKACRHKDITSKNILIKHNKVFVTDFGLALDWSELSKSKTEGPVGAVSRHYVAPEVWNERGPRGSASDMWALGCVFLDIVTVLKGKTLVEKREFLENRDPYGINPRENFDGYKAWMKVLGELNPSQDTLPMSWTERLVVLDPVKRDTAEELLDSILNSTDVEDGHTYHCLDCGGDDVGEVPLVRALPGSDLGDDVNEDILESTSKNYNGAPESIDQSLCHAVLRGDKKDTWLWLSRWVTRPDYQLEMVKSKALHSAAERGFTVIVTDLLRHGFDVNSNLHQSCPLHGAVEKAHLDTVRVLLDHDADPNARNFRGQTPLHQACDLGLVQIAEILLDKGGNINATDNYSSTPLHCAVTSKSATIVSKLLKDPSIDLNVRETRGFMTNPFFAAVLGGPAGLVEPFIDYGVDINKEEPNSKMLPLHAAVSAKRLDVAQLLIRNGANVNAKLETYWGRPPLFVSIERNDESMLQQLLDAGADPNITDNTGKTAIHAVVEFGFPHFLPVLTQKGVDVNRQDDQFIAPIGLALRLKKMTVAQALLDVGATLQVFALSAGRPVSTLLHHAVLLNNTEALHFLIGKIPIDSRDATQLTPLMVAATKGHVDCAQILIDNGADMEAKDPQNQTALFGAIMSQSKAMVELLLQKGANIHVESLRGQTPLHIAVLGQNTDIAKLLIERGADPSKKDAEKKSFWQRAKQVTMQLW